MYPSSEICPREEFIVDSYRSEKSGDDVIVSDPYRWMEDVESPRTVKWIDYQVGLFEGFMNSHCAEERNFLKKKLTERWNFERYSCPFKRGGAYYFFHNSGLQNQSVLYTQVVLDEEKEIMLDPNLLSEDGTVALGNIAFSEDGTHFAYSLARSGSDWNNIHIKNVSSKQDLPEILEWVKFSNIAWDHKNEGFFYCRYSPPKKFMNVTDTTFDRGTEVDVVENQMVYYHRLNSSQSDDVLVFKDSMHPKWMFGVEVTDCGKYLILSISESCEPVNRIYLIDITQCIPNYHSQAEIYKLIDNFEAEYDYVTNEGTKFWFKTNLNAPNYRVICVDISSPSQENWIEVIPHSDAVLTFVSCVDEDKLIVSSLQDVKEGLKIYSLEGSVLKEILEPSILTVSGLTGKKNQSEFFYKLTSFVQPGEIRRFDLKSFDSSVFLQTKIDGLTPENFIVKQVFYSSKDGTRVPMFIVHPKDIEMNGENPVLLYGYGGFNISLTPSFSVSRWTFCDLFNGVLAIPNLRGGGEYGQRWHHGGTKLNKQNVFDDFIAAAEYVVSEKFTKAEKIAINGGSNGGLLVAACLNQRPDLYGCAISQVGVLDMLRFHKFTIGHAWCSDYGNAEENPNEFDALYAYSPLHNVNAAKAYPSVLITTADHDDRVVPLHSFKYAATLQHLVGSKDYQKNPLLIRIEVKAGHGAGKPLQKTIEEIADVYAFISYSLKAPVNMQ